LGNRRGGRERKKWRKPDEIFWKLEEIPGIHLPSSVNLTLLLLEMNINIFMRKEGLYVRKEEGLV
jgi:hypothetical protein